MTTTTTTTTSMADSKKDGTTAPSANTNLVGGLKEAVEELFSPARLSSNPILASTLNTQGAVPLPVVAQLAEVQAVLAREKKKGGGNAGAKGKKKAEEKEEEGGSGGVGGGGGGGAEDVVSLLAEALRSSKLVQLTEDGGGLRPRVARSTIIARDLPADVTEAEVRALFQKYADAVVEVRCEYGLWYIKLAGEDDAKTACQELNLTPFRDQLLRLRIRPEVGQTVYGLPSSGANTPATATTPSGAGPHTPGAPSSPRLPGGMMLPPGAGGGRGPVVGGLPHLGPFPTGGPHMQHQHPHAHTPTTTSHPPMART